MRLEGIDVSSVQHVVDWSQVAASGVRFVAIKSSEGLTSKDPMRGLHFRGATAAGLRTILYHFDRTGEDPRVQVQALWNSLTGQMPHRFALDVETAAASMTSAELVKQILDFDDAWTAYAYQRVVLYSYQAFLQGRLAPAARLEPRILELPLWIAQYPAGFKPYAPDATAQPHPPAPWGDWAIWQYSGNGGACVPGIPIDCDRDLFNGDEDALREFCGLPPVSPPSEAAQ